MNLFSYLFSAATRLTNFSIEVGQVDEVGHVTYRECDFHAGPAGSIATLTCSRPTCGRFLRLIKQPDDATVLTLCELEVYGIALETREHCAVTPSGERVTRCQFARSELSTPAERATKEL